jgi:hypothetical protein
VDAEPVRSNRSPTPTPIASAVAGASATSSRVAGSAPSIITIGGGSPAGSSEKVVTSTDPASATPVRLSFTATTSSTAATAPMRSSAGAKSLLLAPRKVSSSAYMPNRSGWLVASSTPSEKVRAATMPTTPTTEPTRAGSTGTDCGPLPRSSAKREPTATGTGAPRRPGIAARREVRPFEARA